MTPEQTLCFLTHPEKWPHGMQLPVIRKGGNPMLMQKDAGIVSSTNLCRVWTDVYLGDDPWEGKPEDYRSPEQLLSEWRID